ncbi:reverse transcriptase domain-containing protein [Citrus sinensis]|uniref:Reverse transcriptase domain-containing protein n=1 Tax=Citrus sinensis TaxID=2711 RepID=A0ACB8M108_CITSI|nr:reverse transcriptase domain-containing protein [Citrus sinensis]
MAGSSNRAADLQRECARLQIDEEEEGDLEVAGEEDEDNGRVKIDFRYCLVGRFLTDKVINFVAMKNTMAALWRPGKGVCIKGLSHTLFLFQFFHEIDVRRILDSGSWTFDQHILLVHRLGADEQPQNIPLFDTTFWVQVYNLPLGFQSESILQRIGNYIGSFLESDENNLKGVWRNYMRLRVSLDWFWVDFKYERLNMFCFICGLLGHTEHNCPSLYDCTKAPPRRGMMNSGERWLRSEPPEMETDFSGNYPKSGVSRIIGENGATKSANDGSKSRGKEQMVRHVPTVSKLPNPDITYSQLSINGQEMGASASGMVIIKANAVKYDSQFIISDAKRHPCTVQVLTDLAKQYNPAFIFLIETLCHSDKLEKIKIQLGYAGLFVVDKVGRSGGLAFFWKPNFIVHLIKFGKTFIDVAVRNSEGKYWRVTGFYGFPESSRRRESWSLLRSLALASSLPWVCIGDFNDLLYLSEKRGKHEAVLESGLFDLGMVGYPFTWERCRGSDDWVEECLDRVLASNSWIHLFPNAKVCSLEASCSDHLPIFLDPSPVVKPPRNKKFQFENSWLREFDCLKIMKESWASSVGVPIQSKIASCGSALFRWGGHLTRDYRAFIAACKKKMAIFRGKRDSASVDSFVKARKRYNKLLHSHETFWKQMAKSSWLKECDMNSSYFHAMASARKKKNMMGKLRNVQGQWCTTPEDINEIIVLQCVELRISAEQNTSLLEPFNPADVRAAIFSMHPDKSPGPDGMNPTFFQKFWSIIGDDVSAACLKFIQQCMFPAEVNETLVILIPKKSNPDYITNFRPIALCNVLYKIVAKMLASRLKLVLGSIISDSQSAFIPGRIIIDNIMISIKGRERAAALKIDMAKAYDRIEWPFLSAIMLKMGFDHDFIKLIMLCVSTVSYKFSRDGMDIGPIIPSRGLRQGDPLSPYLFIICAEGLSSLIHHHEKAGMLHGVRIARCAPCLTHLFFADDCFIFFKARDQEARVMKSILSIANVNNEAVHSICSLLGVQAIDNQRNYLRLPSHIGRSKIILLSRAGKEILLKTVAQAMPNYAMNIFLLPKELCRELEKMMNSFWWGRKKNGSGGINWMTWERMCKPKTHGGIGFKRLHLFNVAMLGNQDWCLLTNPNALATRLFKARYFPTSSFVEALLGSNPSFFWRSILVAQPAILRGSRIQIRGGQQTIIGNTPWLPDKDSGFISSSLPANIASASVDSLMVPNQRRWDFDVANDIFNIRDRDLILQIPLGSRLDKDSWLWLPDSKGLYTVRSCYRLLNYMLSPLSNSGWRKLWQLPIPAKVKNFLWRAMSNVLPTADNLLQRRVEAQVSYPICHSSSESVFHVLVTCHFAKACWISSMIGYNGSCLNFTHWMEELFNRCNIEECSMAGMICWGLWLNRNNKVWNDVNGRVQPVLNTAGQNLFLWQQARKNAYFPLIPDTPGHGSVCWFKPCVGWYKCNVDAAIVSSRGIISLGAVIRSAQGDFIAAKSDIFPGRFEAREAEAIEFAFQYVILEMDSLQVFNALHDKTIYPNGFGSIIDDCRALARSLGEVTFSFVRRFANSAAHIMAQVGCSMSGLDEWRFVPPPWLVEALAV